jgi:linoleoyl-CoA desaturase
MTATVPRAAPATAPRPSVPAPGGVVKISFTGRAPGDFVREMKERVERYFTSRHLSPHADWRMILTTVAMLALVFVPYGLILSNQLTPWAMLGLAVVMGVGFAGMGFAVCHDALHGAYSANPKVNRAIGLTFDLLGANGYMWRITHNVIHHTYTNIHGIDEDLEVSPLVRLSPGSEHKPVHRYQHLYAWALYACSTLFWAFVKDFKYFLQRDLGPYRAKRHPPHEIALLVVTKAVYYGWALVIPFFVVDVAWWQFLIGVLALHLTAGLILGVVFQLAHVVEGAAHVETDADGCVEAAWMVHQLATTSNFATGNRLLTWYVGGLNHQVEHHLFPRVCSIHYPAITPIVREVTAKYGVPYHQQPTLWAAIRSHYRMLKLFGAGATMADAQRLGAGVGAGAGAAI